MVTTFCQRGSQISDLNDYHLLQTTGGCYGCPCQLSPPINEFTYCILKKICKKILKEICQEQKKEVYTVFDGGRCSKYEALMKAEKKKNEKNSICSMLRQQRCTKARRASVRGSVDLKAKRKSKEEDDSKVKKRKDKKQKEKEEKDDKDKERERERAEKERREREARLRQEKADKLRAERERAEREKAEREKAEREKADRDKALEKASNELASVDKKRRCSRKGLQACCGRRQRGLLVNRLDIDRDFSKRQSSCSQMDPQFERFEEICVSRPCRIPSKRPCALSRVDSIRPCDYLRAHMEYREMCCPRVCPPCDPCMSRGACIANDHSQVSADPCGPCPTSYVPCMG